MKAFGARNCILFACFESASGRGLWNWTVTSLMKKMKHVSGKILFGRVFSSDFFRSDFFTHFSEWISLQKFVVENVSSGKNGGFVW